MASGLLALLDDVAAIAKVAAATLDDVAAATAKASAKSAGVVIDDTAVTPAYVQGFTADRELPVIWKIAKGSLVNKLGILLPLFMLLAAFAPFALTPLLMLGGGYLCFEAAEKLSDRLHLHKSVAKTGEAAPASREGVLVRGAIRTDLILSAEILAIALGELDGLPLGILAASLVGVSLAVTVFVYGMVAAIVRMDDIGLALARRDTGPARAIGRRLVTAMPKLLAWLSVAGIAAMAWVGGGILLHGLATTGLLPALPAFYERLAAAAAAAVPAGSGLVHWLVFAILAGLSGLLLGLPLAAAVHLGARLRRPRAPIH